MQPPDAGSATRGSVTLDGAAAAPSQSFDALLVKLRIGDAVLVEPPGGWTTTGIYALLTPGTAPRILQIRLDSAPFQPIRTTAGLIRATPGGTDATCQRPDTACVKGWQRLDHTNDVPLDVEAALQSVVAEYHAGTPARAEREHAAETFQPEDLQKNPASIVRKAFWFWPSWDAQQRRLSVTLTMRDERSKRTQAKNPDPRAGTLACDGPPTPGCTPVCMGPFLETITELTTEATARVSFDASGARQGSPDTAARALPGRLISEMPSGACAREAAPPREQYPLYPIYLWKPGAGKDVMLLEKLKVVSGRLYAPLAWVTRELALEADVTNTRVMRISKTPLPPLSREVMPALDPRVSITIEGRPFTEVSPSRSGNPAESYVDLEAFTRAVGHGYEWNDATKVIHVRMEATPGQASPAPSLSTCEEWIRNASADAGATGLARLHPICNAMGELVNAATHRAIVLGPQCEGLTELRQHYDVIGCPESAP
jgi:hypothetical protein